MSHEWDDNPIGYKQPPVWTRFRKGMSGNPRGRPKKPKPETKPTPVGSSLLDDALRAERNRPVKVNGSGGTQDLPMYDVVIRSLTARAAKGDVQAQKEICRLWYELEHRDAVRKLAEDEREEKVFNYIVDLKSQQARKWATVDGTDAEPADPWPHSDDVIVNHETKKWRIRGPFDETDVSYFEYCRAERDALFVYSSLLLGEPKGSRAFRDAIDTFWVVWDVQLPKRWQIFDRFEPLMLNFAMMPLRKLRSLKDEYARRVERLRPIFSAPLDKEGYRTVKSAMKPLLKLYGYRSLAEFERAYEIHGDTLNLKEFVNKAEVHVII